MEVLAPGAPNGVSDHDSPQSTEPEAVLRHLSDVLQVTLGAARRELEAVGSLLCKEHEADSLSRCTRFASEQEAIYAQKDVVEESSEEENINGAEATPERPKSYTYTLSSEPSLAPTTVASVAFIKGSSPLNSQLPLPSQLQVVTLPVLGSLGQSQRTQSTSSLAYERLYSLVHLALAPYFDAHTSSQRLGNGYTARPDPEGKGGVPGAKKKITELENILRHLEQNVEIPALYLPLHELVEIALQEAEARNVPPSIELLPADTLADSRFLHSLHGTVNGWVKSIQAITKMSREPECETAAQEVNFWLSMETALAGIEQQLRQDGVQLTIDILRNAKRFQATLSFQADTGLKESLETVQRYNIIMHDFPLDDLLGATSLATIQDALTVIFNHLNKKLRISPYPIRRALALVEAISGDLNSQVRRMLNGRTLMRLDYTEFVEVIKATGSIWKAWDEQLKDFTNVARDVMRRRNDRFIPIKPVPRHTETAERLRYVSTFRNNHEQLHKTILTVLGSRKSGAGATNGRTKDSTMFLESADIDAVSEVTEAYNGLQHVDVLDTSPEGTQSWVQAEMLYNDRTSRVENSIISRLRDRLATARSANEMFRVFSKFNALLVRPKVRGAIIEYQTQLLESVEKDISALHERFKMHFDASEASLMFQIRDIPQVSASIIWVRQIEKQLDGYMEKVRDVLGEDWNQQADGEKLQHESQLFREKLKTDHLYNAWHQQVLNRKLAITGRLFTITRTRASGNLYELQVNFDSQVIVLFKEVRNLAWLKFQIPHGIRSTSREAKSVYPFAVSLSESSRSFVQTTNAISRMPDIAPLLNGYQNHAQSMISKGLWLHWDAFVNPWGSQIGASSAEGEVGKRQDSKHAQYVRDLAQAMAVLQTKTGILSSIYETVQSAISELRTCSFTQSNLRAALDRIQTGVDKLNLENYANLTSWVDRLNRDIETILQSRLADALGLWIAGFTATWDEHDDALRHNARDSTSDSTPDSHQVPKFPRLSHELIMQNQLIYLEPPLEFARSSWLQHLDSWLSVVCNLERIQSTRYQVAAVSRDGNLQSLKFSSIPLRCMDDLEKTNRVIQDRVERMASYLEEWFRYQSLWDLQSEQVFHEMGDDLAQWHELLIQIRQARSTFDTSSVNKTFGNVTIAYDQVQTKISSKYDQWQREVTANFGGRLGTRMRDVHGDISILRTELEGQGLEASSTAQAVAFITVVQKCSRKANGWESEVETFRQGQTTLHRQRYQFPADWLPIDQVEHEWEAFKDILDRKSRIIHDQTDSLRDRIIREDQAVRTKISDAISQWNEEKPISGATQPDVASSVLSAFRLRFERLQTDSESVAKAKESFDLPDTRDNRTEAVLEEVHDFTTVWAALSTIWQSINDLRATLWSTVQTRKLRQSIENLIKMTKEMPSRMRQYAAFEEVQNVLRQLLKVNPLLADLKSEAVRERHWIKIFKTLKPGKRYSEVALTVGDVWDLKLVSTETAVKDIIAQARGEMALEEFLRQVRDTWQNYALELVIYQNKCRLIRGWDDLFTKSSENLNSLQAMRHSPYYKEFEEEASAWEDKLNRVHVLFDIWIDVQRQWVYLEGVFTGSTDIKHLLPTETMRFQGINSEFLAMMKKVTKSPFVLDVLAIPGVQKSLERLVDLLGKIQKALGEYLERERMSFPRFYFVGDEDLLEIIGNSNDSTRVAKHFTKMFAGLSGLVTDDSGSIVGVASKEGEKLMLGKEVSLIKLPKINDWLAALESSLKHTLAAMLRDAISQFEPLMTGPADVTAFDLYLSTFPAQIVVLATQVVWTKLVEKHLEAGGGDLQQIYDAEIAILDVLAATVLRDLDAITRKKCEHLITEFVHQRDVIGRLIKAGASSPNYYLWLLQMRYVYDTNEADVLKRLRIHMANAKLDYGYEYLGVADRLVRTPLTDRCFLTLTQAMSQRLGGSPYGPAGTGKTESVKALGLQLGRFTLVFCCDDTFDFQAMGRIFLGICQVGAWGCFDEFNRLEERILSAVSQQIQNIQIGLRQGEDNPHSQVDLAGRRFRVNLNTGIFITMNPGYAGRSNLPDNLKKLFRSVAMSKPDKELIAEVMLFSQGFKRAKELSVQTVPFFDHCSHQLSKQAHYDFGLRALKSVLISSGGLKRTRILQRSGEADANEAAIEPQIIVQSIRETIAPKLIRDDVNILHSIQEQDFPGVQYVPGDVERLTTPIYQIAKERNFTTSDAWMTKILQLYQIQKIHHGVMMVGNSGSGKSSIWKLLLQALQSMEGVEGVYHVIDPKVMSKESLYGTLDSTTREWTDGLFTGILRKIVDNLRGEDSKRHWIVFDGDVDPEWVENLNSVLDDNKLLTLPNGERLSIPPNVRIMFEVESLKHATLATVSRCGMVWFSDDTVTSEMILDNYLQGLKSMTFDELDDDTAGSGTSLSTSATQTALAGILREAVLRDNFLVLALAEARKYTHIMEFTDIRALNSLFGLFGKICRMVLEYNIHHADFPLDAEQMGAFTTRKMLLAVVWALTGDCPLAERRQFGNYLGASSNIELPSLDDAASLVDFDVLLPHGQWTSWQSQVPLIEVNTHSVTQTDVIIPTVDTIRHEDVLYSWLAEHRPLLLCGPPGSGKTMTLFSALRKLPNMEVVGLNFSSATTPELIIKTFDQYCEYRKTLNGTILSPTQIGRWLVIFCDEINLPAPDRYATQRAISFLRQLIEHNGFWSTKSKTWVTLDRIQFVGACNPPTDAGRHPLGARFLRHAPLIMVDYPGEQSLTQIYGTFASAILKITPLLRGYAGALTKAMVQFYSASQARFTAKIQPHYVYSPRELTRWVRGIYEAIKPLENLPVEGLVRIWAHEALRLFQDRLVMEDERLWTADLVRTVAADNFPTIDLDAALHGPILFSNWLSKNYVSVDQEQLREFVKARLRTFCEEEVDVPLVLFNDVLEHALRIDRVFRQPQGHLILIGVSGSGKTTLSRFVAWMNGLKIFQIKVHGKYSAEDFDEDLRGVLRACGCRGEKICFIMDEANVLDSGFLERMNTLLANGEVPGLFEGDEHSALMTACKEGAQRQGLLLDSPEELYKWFTQQIVRNLHVVFTMNPPKDGLSSKAATSPALFNRCVLNWMGDWSEQALYQVGLELTQSIDLDKQNFTPPDSMSLAYPGISLPISHRDAVINTMVFVHSSVRELNARTVKQSGRVTYLTPRHYLDFVAQYVKLFGEKRESLEEQQRHLNVGLEKLRDTVDKVRDLRKSLAQKKEQLQKKDAEANEKLQRMVSDQREAETRQKASLEIQTALEQQDREVAQRREVVERDLARAEPAVLEAQQSVSNIKRQHLTEVRSMGNPPSGVKLALESVCTLLGHRVDSWKTIQGIVRRDDFIASIVNYDNERQMTPHLRIKMRNDFLSKEDFTFERVNRASKACGPLVQWVHAQVDYSEILDRVGPLRDEVSQLEEQALQTKAEAKAIENTIVKLEDSISTYKSEYASLISETQSIKMEMARVQLKVDRSVSLLDSLSKERGRWETGSKSFETQITTLIGDVLVAAAFLAYAGYYEQNSRKALVDDWLRQLSDSGIACKSNNPVTEYLSSPDERLKWHDHSLPVDDLCTENAIMLQRFNRYPLIIDPSGRTVEFLRNENKERKLTVTSFLDDTFVKQLESALRFGNPILIQDAEHMDPILNHVLNKEYQKTGGRVLIQIGKQEIDFSPAFKLYMSTRDPSTAFPPDVCSRATFVNFTVTRSSLQTQSLNEVLKAERPDVDERRTNLVKLQGEFNTNLRRLERNLLQALNESRGNILDDDKVIETLERLKKEAQEISCKMEETEGVMAEVDAITQEYKGISQACSAVFAVLEQLHQLNHSYQFSLQYFVDIFNHVLHGSTQLSGEKNIAARCQIILRGIFAETYRRTSMSLLQKDRITLALLLARSSPFEMDRAVLEVVLDQRLQGVDITSSVEARSQGLALVSQHAFIQDRLNSIPEETWKKLATSDRAESVVAEIWKTTANTVDQHLWSALLMKLFKPDRLIPATEKFVAAVFGPSFFDHADDLNAVVKQVTPSTPIALDSSPGFDASYKVDALVSSTGSSCANIAMGSREGVAAADKAISNAAANGTWVLVKNVQLAPVWLQSLEKRLGSLKPHADFRLFLSMESSPKIPANLIRACRMLKYEQPAGIRANMKDSISSLSKKADTPPVEKGRLYLLLSFLHAVVQERLRYVPTLGWSGFWEFNDSDYDCCASIITSLIDQLAQNRSNIPPSNLPWPLLRVLITEMYGGKIDSDTDRQILENLVARIFDVGAFEEDYRLAEAVKTSNGGTGTGDLLVPGGRTMRDFAQWVDGLPEREPPTYLGLPADAERLLLVGRGRAVVADVERIADLLDEEEQLASAGDGS